MQFYRLKKPFQAIFIAANMPFLEWNGNNFDLMNVCPYAYF